MKLAYISQKNIWTVVGAVVVLLILAATILSQAAFKAEEPNLAIYIDPPTKNLAVNEQFMATLKIQPTGSVIVTGVQLALAFDDSVIELTGAVAAEDFQTKKLTNKDGSVFWAIVPSTQLATQPGKEISLGTIKFTALKSSATQVTFDQSKTIIATLDAASTPSLYNGLSSVQNSYVTVSGENSNPIELPLVQPSATETAVGLASAQRVKKIEALPVYDTAYITVDLLYKGKLRIDFGETEKLGSTIEPTVVTSHHGVRLMGLKPGTQYFYKITIISEDETSQISAATRSFTTNATLTTNDVATIQVFSYPSEVKDTTVVYLVPKDKDGQLITGTKLDLDVTQGKSAVSSIAEINGLYQSSVNTILPAKQTVQLSVTASSGVANATSITFDPNFVESSEPVAAPEEYLTLNQRVMMILAGLIAGLLLLGLLFVKLARLK